MKKVSIYLFSSLLQISSLFCCAAESTKSKSVSRDTHITALAALFSIPRPSEDNPRNLHTNTCALLLTTLARPYIDPYGFELNTLSEKTSYGFSLFTLSEKTSHCMIGLPYSPPDTQFHVTGDPTTSIIPMFELHTELFDSSAGNAISVFDVVSRKKSQAFLSPGLTSTSKEINLCINPNQKNTVTYTMSATCVKEATDTTSREFAAAIKIQSESTKEAFLVPKPVFLNKSIIVATSHPEESLDDRSQIVRVWEL